MKDTDSSDAVLVARCVQGDSQAFDDLVLKYQKTLFNTALRMTGDFDTAEEVTQEAFVKAYQRLGTFDQRFRFFSWLYRILINETLDQLERRKRHEALSDWMTSSEPGPAELQERSDAEEMLREALLAVAPEQRALLLLKHFEELTYEEIGVILEIPVKKVKSRLFTARMQLKAALEKRGFGS